MGQKLREKLLPLINGHEKVVLDFTGVNVVSNSFADECIAKLLLEMPLAELKRRGSCLTLKKVDTTVNKNGTTNRDYSNRETLFESKRQGSGD